jgi:hypothetical protein
MGVIIDDFVVVTDAPTPPGEGAPPSPQKPQPSTGPNPEDIRHIVRTREQRASRLTAH